MSEIKEQIIESKPLREQVADIVRGMILRGFPRRESSAGWKKSAKSRGSHMNVLRLRFWLKSRMERCGMRSAFWTNA